jgi:hypothetical protein
MGDPFESEEDEDEEIPFEELIWLLLPLLTLFSLLLLKRTLRDLLRS